MTSQILTICRILEGVRAKNLEATILFIDFSKTSDSIHRGKMEQILLTYGLAIMMLYKTTKLKVRSLDGDTVYFDIEAGVLLGDTLAPYLFIVCLDNVLRKYEKNFDGNYTRMLRAIMNKSWRQRSTKQQLHGNLPLVTKTIQVRLTIDVRHCWGSGDELLSDILLWTPS